MRFLPLALICAALAACGSDEGAHSDGFAQLTVTVDDDGTGSKPPRVLELNCATATESDACAAAGRLKPEDLGPPQDDMACTQIYGGPETASIKGTLDGHSVDAHFSRTDGCQIARWDAVAPLLDEVP